MWVSFVLSLCSFLAFGFSDTGVKFSESFTGFQAPGDLDYEAAYKAGKASGNKLSFDLEGSIFNATAWAHNSTHTVALAGNLSATNLATNVAVSGQLQLFPMDVANDTLTLKYFLPFKGKDGKDYHLEGMMAVPGYDCINLLHDLTTIYCHIKTGAVYGQGSIVTTGIVQLPPETIIPSLRSMKPINNGTKAEWVETLGKFWGLVTRDVLKLCLNKVNDWNFWYTWGSQDGNGFLVDLIKSPTQLELRLCLFNAQGIPAVTRQMLPLSAFSQINSSITMGPLTLTASTLKGNVGGVPLNLTFDVSRSKNQFLPPLLGLIPTIIPNITSHYGTLTKDGTVAGVRYSAQLPSVLSTYNLGLSMDVWAWSMVSAMSFPGTDLQLEIVGMALPGSVLGLSYVHFQGRDFHLDDPYSNITFWTKTGHEDDTHQLREFSLNIVGSVANNLQVKLDCAAPVSQFALLDRYGLSVIHSTVLGKCTCAIGVDHKTPETFVTQNALLEVKNFEG